MNSIVLPVTLTIAGAAALIAIWLGIRVGQVRGRTKISIGDGGDAALIARMRAQANYIEYAPFFLILLALVELAYGGDTLDWANTALWAAGILFIIGRILHPFGLDRPGMNLFRTAGILLTWLPLLALAIWALSIPYTSDTITTEETVTSFG
jgi:uncharacterized membrane protein YecN with MAPEG domain